MTSALAFTAKRMPSASQNSVPWLPLSSTLTGRIIAPTAAPTNGIASEEKLPLPAMMEAIAVPWPLSSFGWAALLTKSHPAAKSVVEKTGACL